MNTYRGEFEIELNGKKKILVYDWRAIATLQKMFGDDASKIVEKMSADLEVTAQVVAIGLRKYDPEITAEQVMEASPRIMPTVKAVVQSLNVVMGIEVSADVKPRPPEPPPE